MAEYKLGSFTFETEEELEQAKKELALIKAVRDKYDISNPKIAKAIVEKFNPKTILGERFVKQLNKTIAQKNEEESLISAIDQRIKEENDNPTRSQETSGVSKKVSDLGDKVKARLQEEDIQRAKEQVKTKAIVAGKKAKKIAQDNDLAGKANVIKKKTIRLGKHFINWIKEGNTAKKIVIIAISITVIALLVLVPKSISKKNTEDNSYDIHSEGSFYKGYNDEQTPSNVPDDSYYTNPPQPLQNEEPQYPVHKSMELFDLLDEEIQKADAIIGPCNEYIESQSLEGPGLIFYGPIGLGVDSKTMTVDTICLDFDINGYGTNNDSLLGIKRGDSSDDVEYILENNFAARSVNSNGSHDKCYIFDYDKRPIRVEIRYNNEIVSDIYVTDGYKVPEHIPMELLDLLGKSVEEVDDIIGPYSELSKDVSFEDAIRGLKISYGNILFTIESKTRTVNGIEIMFDDWNYPIPMDSLCGIRNGDTIDKANKYIIDNYGAEYIESNTEISPYQYHYRFEHNGRLLEIVLLENKYTTGEDIVSGLFVKDINWTREITAPSTNN